MRQTKTITVPVSAAPAPPPGSLRTFYVAPTGNDANSGTIGSPWLTLQAAANRVLPGDNVIVQAGIYDGFNIPISGTQANRIKFTALPGTIIGSITSFGGANSGINSSGRSYLTIDGFTFAPKPVDPAWRAAVRMGGTPGNWVLGNVVRNCRCVMRVVGKSPTPDGLGIFTSWNDGLLIENNAVSGTYDSGIYVSNSARNYVVRGNDVSDCGGNGIHNNGDLTQGAPGINVNALIEGNTIHNVGFASGGQAISCDGVQDSRIQKNLVYGAASKGISLYAQNGAAGCTRNTISNNTIVCAPTAIGSPCRLPGGNDGNSFFNNIFVAQGTDINSDGHYSYAVSSNGTFDFNAITDPVQRQITLARWRTLGNDAHGVLLNLATMFVDSANNDWRLKPGSPLIGAGMGGVNIGAL